MARFEEKKKKNGPSCAAHEDEKRASAFSFARVTLEMHALEEISVDEGSMSGSHICASAFKIEFRID